MSPNELIEDLRMRCILKAVAGEISADRLPIVYCGFDPTGDSLHIGNLVALVTLKRFQSIGCKVLALIGGATAMIGDPSGRSTERNLLDDLTINKNIVGIKSDLEKVLDFSGDNPAILVNNMDWTHSLSTIDFLRDIGKHFRVNTMLHMTSVKDRIEREEGLSFTEFTYSLLQAHDFQVLFEKFGCNLQLGGSDQWGNITSGIELIRKTLNKPVAGLTLELLLDDSGKKFGKSVEGNPMFLSAHKTSPYTLFQHFFNSKDETDVDSEVERFLKFFTFLSLKEIADIMIEHNKDKSKHLAQKTLATNIVKMIHKEHGLQAAETATSLVFGNKDITEVPNEVLEMLHSDLPTALSVPVEQVKQEKGLSLIDLLVDNALQPSKSEARRLIQNKGLSINNKLVTVQTSNFKLEDQEQRIVLLRIGKKNLIPIKFIG